MDPPLVFSSRPGALVLRLPGSASATAAVHLMSRSTIAGLAAIVAGRDSGPAAGDPGSAACVPDDAAETEVGS